MIREYRASDEAALRALHAAQGHPYPFPDLSKFVGVLVAVDENDVAVQALAARKTVEVFMLGDPNWRTPAWRFGVFKELHQAMHGLMLSQGYTDAHIWVPPTVVKAFGRRLVRDFGWISSKWQCFCKYL